MTRPPEGCVVAAPLIISLTKFPKILHLPFDMGIWVFFFH